ncbi:MAG: protein translocase subunit SecD [Candidatus Portnoybacteria bacterium CG10_big_fil_rev_8_21_14_0_10_44_7]|uniref:Protein translocase subunit SecD n=1 Tax=Candidatus Portnoybacteria bacterium CG10_big_fil_rev_8_21_14_0_10_44_7 TaxID=1974816 RepID=A0A2M8KIN4_9BACT|nr:MAG: protein translocase subunit SecD [Candidatus Portnoybacteria bacterium CG10_big_fil_rev_8_21_14_0_10_44_7]
MSFSRTIGKILTAPIKALGGIFKPQKTGRPVKLFVLVLLLAVAAGFFAYPQAWDQGAGWLNAQKNKTIFKAVPDLPLFYNLPFRLGLDLQGGTHLVYEADLSNIEAQNYGEAMQGVRDVIERRVNLFGVTEPVVQINKTGDHYRLVVELAGIKDISQAISMIGETPALDFRQAKTQEETGAILAAQQNGERLNEDPYFTPTILTGRYLKNAQVNFDPNTFQPIVTLEFDSEGAQLFEQLTQQNIGKTLAIYLDGFPISVPRVNEKITGGRAQITGNFTTTEAKELVRRLNAGALPVPIKLINQQTIGASLGADSLRQSLSAGLFGLLAVAAFMLLWYRAFGLLAILELLVYTALVLAVFKIIPVTLTLAGIAGFILSIGMAVDANILIFERLKEEVRSGRNFTVAAQEGFLRAWPSIRDANLSTLITCVILFWLGTSIVKGFALTLGIGVLASMFSAVFVTRTLLRMIGGTFLEKGIFYMRLKGMPADKVADQ